MPHFTHCAFKSPPYPPAPLPLCSFFWFVLANLTKSASSGVSGRENEPHIPTLKSHIKRLPPLAGFKVMPQSQSLSWPVMHNQWIWADACLTMRVARHKGLKGDVGAGKGVCDVQMCGIMTQLLDICQVFTCSCHSALCVCVFVCCVCVLQCRRCRT